MEREIIIVGAGPAGSTTAMALAQKGRDVLLIDRQSFPRDKVCGDGIPAGAISLLYDLGMRERIEDGNYYVANKLLLSSPNQHVLEADLRTGPRGENCLVIPRLEFDYAVQQHAVSSGAEFCQTQVTGPIVEDGRVVGVTARVDGRIQEIRARVVVAADGATSVIARALRPDKHEDKHKAVAMRAYVENMRLLPRQVEFYLYKGILPGYAWIFPMGENKANIGLGMRLDKFRQSDRNLEEMLEIFLEMPVIKERLRPDTELHHAATWQLGLGSQKNIRRAFDGALLVGDAAGMINPLTGGGIHSAVEAGLIASRVIHQALGKNGGLSLPTLHQYERLCHEAMWSGMRRSFLIQNAMNLFPRWVDAVVRWGSSNSNLAQTFVNKL